MDFYNSEYALHGSVAIERDPLERLQLFRKDMIDPANGTPFPGCELWRVGSTSGLIVIAINPGQTRFRGEGGAIYVLIDLA